MTLTPTANHPAKTDFLAPAILADPYPHYHRLRASGSETNRRGGWIRLFAYDDVAAALQDRHLSVAKVAAYQDRMYRAILPPHVVPRMEASAAIRATAMLYSDPPDHTRVRGIIQPFFTPRALAALQARIETIVAQLLTPLVARGGGDLIAEFAYLLPATVIAELLGIPPSDHRLIKRWSDDSVGLIGTGPVVAAQIERINQSVTELDAYLKGFAETRRRAPRNDILTALVAAESRNELTWPEIVGTCWSILIGGHETTTSLIGNGLLALVRHPDQLAVLRSNPDLMPSAIEELLRYDSPIQQTARIALEPLTLNGRPITAGTLVECWLGAANRDPAHFPDPDRLDLRRTPNRHLAFSHGLHFCLGHVLSRREAHAAFTTLLKLPSLEIATQDPTWNRSAVFRCLQALPIVVTG